MANRFSPGKGGRQAQTNDRIANAVDALSPAAAYSVQTDANIVAAAGGVICCSPRATGQSLVIPEASGLNFNQTIVVMVQAALGPLRIRAAKGLINGAVAFTLAAGYTTLIILRSNGTTGWVTERASGFPIAGDSLAYSGETLNYVGTNSLLVLSGISGNQGTVDISSLVCGGTVTVSGPVADWQIEGFTSTPVKPDGFWFFFTVANTSFLGTLFNEDGTPAVTDRIRCTNNTDFTAQAIQAVVHRTPLSGIGGSSRWFAVTGDQNSGVVQRITSGSGSPLVDFALNPNTRILQLDYGNTAWVIDSIAGGYAGRKLTIENASNTASTGTLVHNSVTGAAANRLILPGDVNRGGYSRYSAELEYDGTDSVWRVVSDTGPQNNSTQILEIRWAQVADAAISESVPAGCTWFEAEGVGGGGGGGGADADDVKDASGGSGGGAGAWFKHRFTVTTGTITGAIGAAGTAGSNTGGNGGAGGTTTVTYDGVSITGPGGLGGDGVTSAASPGANSQLWIAQGSLGGTADANATERANGGDGGPGLGFSVSANPNSAVGGNGGASRFGGGGRGGRVVADGVTSNGTAGVAPGSGGGGGARTSSGIAATGATGGAGAPGAMKLTFYNGPVPVEATIN